MELIAKLPTHIVGLVGVLIGATISLLGVLVNRNAIVRNTERQIDKDLTIHREKLYLDHVAEHSKHAIERLEKAHFTISQLKLHFSITGAYIIVCTVSEVHEFHDWYFEQCEKVHSILSTMALHAPDGKEKLEEAYGFMNNFWGDMHGAIEAQRGGSSQIYEERRDKAYSFTHKILESLNSALHEVERALEAEKSNQKPMSL